MREWIDGLQAGRLSRDEDVVLINALLARSNERIDGDAELWEALKRHINRRNEFLHRGQRPTLEEARESLETCERFLDRMLTLTQRAARRLDILFIARKKMLELARQGQTTPEQIDEMEPEQSDETPT
jgi:hypothetical protein